MRTLVCVLILTLSACALVVGSTPVTLPDGSKGYDIRCNGAVRDISDCMNEAARVCGGPYKIVDRNSETAGGAMAPMGNGAVYVRGVHRTMIVSCGDH